jgi:hypothetical protein
MAINPATSGLLKNSVRLPHPPAGINNARINNRPRLLPCALSSLNNGFSRIKNLSYHNNGLT